MRFWNSEGATNGEEDADVLELLEDREDDEELFEDEDDVSEEDDLDKEDEERKRLNSSFRRRGRERGLSDGNVTAAVSMEDACSLSARRFCVRSRRVPTVFASVTGSEGATRQRMERAERTESAE